MQLLIFNEEFLVSACHQRALITSLPFVHTARRSYRLNDPVRPPDCGNAAGSPAAMPREAVQTLSFRGRRSRNKVSVGEPAEGSLPVFPPALVRTEEVRLQCLPWAPVQSVPLGLADAPCEPPWPGHTGTARAPWGRFAAPCGGRAAVPPSPSAEGCVPHCEARAPARGSRKTCINTQLLSMDILALATMKNAAKCDT